MTSIGRHYMNGHYRVQVAPDGAITVNPGDWLSKYSAAMYNDFSHIHEFGRKNAAGVVEPVKDVNRIIAGEILYHMPTYESFSKGSGTPPPAVNPPAPVPATKPDWMKDAESKLVKDFMKNDFGLKGERLEIIHTIHLGTEIAETTATIAEAAGLLAEGGLVATGASLLSLIVTPIFIVVEIANALEAGERVAGCVAVAYATVAWAFYDPVPRPSPVLVARNKQQYGSENFVHVREAWNESVKETYEVLDQFPAKRGGSLRAWKAIFRGVGANDRQKLMSLIMKEEESKLSSSALYAFQNVGLKYPE